MSIRSSKKTKKNSVRKSFQEFFSFKSKEEKVEHHEQILMFRFLSEIEKLMEEVDINKKQLAKRIGTSASYITQLFRGDKVVNLHTLAKIEVEFEKTFFVKLIDGYNEQLIDVNEDEIIKFLNKKYVHDGCWVFHTHKKASIPAVRTYTELESIKEVAQEG